MPRDNFFYSHAFTMHYAEPSTAGDKDKNIVDLYKGPMNTALDKETLAGWATTSSSFRDDFMIDL